MVLLLAGGCNTVYEWWDFSAEPRPQEPVVSANPPAAEPPPFTNPDASPATDHPDFVVPPESVAAPQVTAVPSSEPKPLPSAPPPVLAAPEGKEDPWLAQAKEAEDALVQAKERLDWATGIGAKKQFPAPYTKATTAYNTAIKATITQNWQDTMTGAQAAVAAVAEIESLLAALQAKEAEDALVRAKERLDWATGIGAQTQFPAPYTKAATAYNTAVEAKTAENWQDTVSGSQAAIAAVAEIESLLTALRAKEAEDALARAKERLDWATGIGAKKQFPAPYTKATTAYNTAVKATITQNWQDTMTRAQAAVAAVGEIESLLAALQAKEAEDALGRAKKRLDWATGIGAQKQFPAPYTKATTAYNTAVKAKTAENWQDTVSGSQAAIAAVAEIESFLAALQAKEAEEALAQAKERLDWATGIGAKKQFPGPYTKAATAYNTAVKATITQNWQDTMTRAQAAVAAVAEIESLLAALQAKEAEDALVRAKERLDWATGIGAQTQFPAPYTKATTAYNTAVKAKTAENWEDTVSGSQAAITAVGEIESLLVALQAKEAEDALARAKERLDWATGVGAQTQFPAPYTKAATAYNTAVKAKTAQNWQDTVNGSQTAIAAVAEIESLLAALQSKEAEDALARAKERLDWATGIGAQTQFPAPYTKATAAYNMAIKATTVQNWQDTMTGAQATVAAVAEIESLLPALQAKEGNTAAHTTTKEAEEALVRAKERLDWATGIGAQTQFPAPYTKATTAYNMAKTAQNWQDTVSGSQAAIAAIVEIESLLADLQAKEAEDALVRAKERLDWATGIGAQKQFPAPYTKATTAYNTAVKAKTAENWQDTVNGSQTAIAAVAEIESLLAALQAKEAEDALARAKERLDWATGIGAQTQFPAPYIKAIAAYSNAVKAKTAQNWQDTVSGSQATVAAVAEIESLLAAFQVKEGNTAAHTTAKEGEDAPVPAKEPLDQATGISVQTQFPAPYTKASTAQNGQDRVSGSFLAALQAKKGDAALQAKEGEDVLVQAKEPLDLATGTGAQTPFPAPYTKASIAQNGQDRVSGSFLAALQAKKGDAATHTTAKEAEDVLFPAKEPLDLATRTGAQTPFPALYTKATTIQNEQDRVSGSLLAAQEGNVAAHTAAKEAEAPRKRGEAEPQFIPSTAPLNSIPLSPETRIKPMSIAPVNMESPPTRSYIVKPGDSYWTIANQFYGNSEQWKLLYETNKHTMSRPDNPHLLLPGITLDIPALSTPATIARPKPEVPVQIEKKQPEPAASRPVVAASLPVPKPGIPYILGTVPAVQEYTVEAGDSYWSIADRFYGDVQLWEIVYEANKNRMSNPDNPHLIFPGMVLTIPGIFGRVL
jgi:nucleoid-associated protein YgaU